MVKSKKEAPIKRSRIRLTKKASNSSNRGRPLKSFQELDNQIFSFEEYLKDTSLLMTLDQFSLIPTAILNYLNKFNKEERDQKYSTWMKTNISCSKTGESKENPYKKEENLYLFDLFNFLKNMLEFTHQNMRFQDEAKIVLYEIMSCFCNCCNKTQNKMALIEEIWNILTVNEIEGEKFKDKFSGRQDSAFKEIVEALLQWQKAFNDLYLNENNEKDKESE